MTLTNGICFVDRKLIKQSLIMFFYGIIISFIIGYVGGLLCACLYQINWPNNISLIDPYLSYFIFSILISIFSGPAVGVQVINNDIGSTIGTCITTNVLPQSVNTGLLLSYTTLYNGSFENITRIDLIVSSGISIGISLLNILFTLIGAVIVVRRHNNLQNFNTV